MGQKKQTIHMLPKLIAEPLDFAALPPEWIPTDLVRFSTSKILYDYQRDGLMNAVKCLYLYFNESPEKNSAELKKSWFERIQQTLSLIEGEAEILDSLGIDNKKDNGIFKILKEYYSTEIRTDRSIDYEYIPFWNYLNRMGFWMATGSGKSLVLIKLVEVLDELLGKNLLESDSDEKEFDILVLSYREDLLTQLRTLVSEYNQKRARRIEIWDLKEYDNVKTGKVLVDKSNINIFLYRSDLISDVTTEANISFEDIDNDGRWLILLDEAHKGDSEESKRQQYYSILSRKGFLFNFSATFTDPWDIITTVVNFNLSEFIKAGYGKNIYLMQDEKSLDFSLEIDDSKKRSYVLQMLVLFSYIANIREGISSYLYYHNPLLVFLGKTVNTKDADLEIIFKLLEDVANGRCEKTDLDDAKKLLVARFESFRTFCFGEGQEEFNFDSSILMNLGLDDVLKHVFHSMNPGEIEVSKNPADSKQIVFKHKNADKPFALLKIGDITNWLKEKLKGYVITDTYDDRSYFDALNEEASPVTILLGAQAFYEGWDSNRPNIMAFINVGKSDAKKYVIQAIGRGIRIEPMQDKRKRFRYLLSEEPSKFITSDDKHPQREFISGIETLFIFGTNENNIERLLEAIRYVEPTSSIPLKFKENQLVTSIDIPLLVPRYSKESAVVSSLPKFDGNKELLQKFMEWVGDDVVFYSLLCVQRNEDLPISTFNRTQSFIQDGDFVQSNSTSILRQMRNLTRFVETDIEKLEGYRDLDNDIVHFRQITTRLDDKEVKTLQEIIDRVGQYKNPSTEKSGLMDDLKKGRIDDAEFERRYQELSKIKPMENYSSFEIKHISKHYYLPLILSEDGKGQYIKHIINVDSERKFIQDLEKYLLTAGNAFEEVDSWLFSRLIDRVDNIFIPYYSSIHNSYRKFYPDFIFWIKKGSRYYIIFVDPKGPTYPDYKEKVDGYTALFGEFAQPKRFTHDSLDVTVLLRLVTDDKNRAAEDYRNFWMDDLDEFRIMLQN